MNKPILKIPNLLNFLLRTIIFDYLSHVSKREVEKCLSGQDVSDKDRAISHLEILSILMENEVIDENKTGYGLLEDINNRKVGERLAEIDWTKNMTSAKWILLTNVLGEFTDYLNFLKTGLWSDDLVKDSLAQPLDK